ncbi:MAG: ABC transporter ATP-binding protein [Gemmatimonadota bacterium]|nr:ABC transporter ATP-binding protein [Gemmatimonadota bacterium]
MNGRPAGPPDAPARDAPLLAVRDLRVSFRAEGGEAPAVDGVDFSLAPGEALGLVGESGCGKSVTALSLLRLVPEPPGRIQPGSSIRWRGEELLEASPRRLREVRGGGIGMVFQEPMTSLNPVLRVGDQVGEAVRRHTPLRGWAARERVVSLLGRVGIPDPARAADAWPHQLSGGQRQRAMIAMALGGEPALLVADEPTTALDVTVQARILDLLADLRRERGLALLLITHDLAVVARVANRVAVMYAGRIVEEAPAADLFARPAHPYTRGLLRARPDPARPGAPLEPIPGSVPGPRAWPPGCRFHPRCPHVADRCRTEAPVLRPLSGSDRRAACWWVEGGGHEAGP